MNSSQRFIVVVVVNSKLHISCSCWNQWEFYYWHQEKQDLTLIEKRRGKEKKMRKKEKNEPESSKMTSNSVAWLETSKEESEMQKVRTTWNWGPFSFGFPSKFSFEFSTCKLWNWGITNTSHCWKCRFSSFPFSWKCFCLSNSTEEFSYWALDKAYKSQQQHSFREASTNFPPCLCLSHDIDHYQSLNLAQAKSTYANREN